MNFLKNKYFKFGVAAVIYLLWVIWVGSYWLLIGLGIVYDVYVSKKVNWTFWKKRKGPNSTFIEWLDALIFAVIAVTLIHIFLFQNYKIPTQSMESSLLVGDRLFVSKVAYGPKMPNTPISFPFMPNTFPIIKTKSYSELINWPYKRLKGSVRRPDCPASEPGCSFRTAFYSSGTAHVIGVASPSALNCSSKTTNSGHVLFSTSIRSPATSSARTTNPEPPPSH